ncbi:hypothetical protein MPSEU_000157300 [Mayamaea pseudoterrestris]|nr:hypothetical protein MPSEU_000157300 [Mayamaea pseudoterrestris]
MMNTPSIQQQQLNQSILLFVVVAGVTTAALLSRRSRRNTSSSDTNKPFSMNETSPPFQHVAQNIVPDLQNYLSNAEQLLLYALYKQATVGDAPLKAPPVYHAVAHAKYKSWSSLRNMNAKEAQEKYVFAVRQMQERVSGNNGNGDAEEDAYHFYDDDDTRNMAPVQSRPAVEEDDDLHEEETGDSTNSNAPSANVFATLFAAAARNDVITLRETLEANTSIDVNQACPRGQTMLHLASDKGSLAVVEYLLHKYATTINVNAFDAHGISVLQTAAIAGHLDVCRLLLEAGADPQQCDHDGDSAKSCVMEDGSDELKALFREFD